jgi:hypothetical protein
MATAYHAQAILSVTSFAKKHEGCDDKSRSLRDDKEGKKQIPFGDDNENGKSKSKCNGKEKKTLARVFFWLCVAYYFRTVGVEGP